MVQVNSMLCPINIREVFQIRFARREKVPKKPSGDARGEARSPYRHTA
jgi:hypothetical protein